jgi:hypothetical protein
MEFAAGEDFILRTTALIGTTVHYWERGKQMSVPLLTHREGVFTLLECD